MTAALRPLARGAVMASVWLIAGLMLAALTPAAQAAPAKVAAQTGFVRVHPACRAPSARDATCFALVRTPAPASEAGKPGVRPLARRAGATVSGPAGGLTPAGLAAAYGYDPAATPTSKQTIAIVDAYNDPAIESDLAMFDSEYGLPACTEANECFEKVGQSGSRSSLPVNDEAGWSVEMSLDVEMAHSACEHCRILLVEADDPSYVDLGAAVSEAVSLGATEVSNSYGGPEGEASVLQDYNHPGVVITAASGDYGFDGWLEELPGRPNIPAALPDVVAVGGTTLTLDEAGERASETVWNGDGPEDEDGFVEGASGGGCSTIFAAQPWQQDVAGFAATGCAGKRSVADVAADANPLTGFDIYDSYNCGAECERFKGEGAKWVTIGGTSLATPLISALYGLAGGSGGVSYPALTLYGHLGDPAALYDVSEGGNGYCDDGGLACGINSLLDEYFEEPGLIADCEGTTACNGAPGFDGPSGVGSPSSLSLFTPLHPTAVEAPPAKLLAGVPSTFSAAGSSDPYPGGAPLSYRWNWDDGTAVSEGVAPGHVFGAAGRYTVSLTVTDAYGLESPVSSSEVLVAERSPGELEAEQANRTAEAEAAARRAAAAKGSSGVSPFKTVADPDATLARTSVKVGPSGALTLLITCPAGESRCQGTVTLRTLAGAAASGRSRTILVASAAFDVAGGKQQAVVMHLSRAARALLRRTGMLRLRARILAHDPAGARHTTILLLRLRAVRRS